MVARKKLGEILVQANALSEAQLRAALNEQRRWGGPLGRILVDMKLISEDAMVQALSHQLNMPSVNLDGREIEQSVIDLVAGELAEQHAMIPFALKGKFLDVAMVDPTNIAAVDAVRIKTRMNVRPALCGPKAFERALSRYYGRGLAPLDVSSGMSNRGTGDIPDSVIPVGTQMYDTGQEAAITGGSASGSATATARRAGQFGLADLAARETALERTIVELRERIEHLEALVARDEDVLRKLLTLLVQKGLATREEILDRIK